jgi:hypothetical protein
MNISNKLIRNKLRSIVLAFVTVLVVAYSIPGSIHAAGGLDLAFGSGE